jgi:hypothetical protein
MCDILSAADWSTPLVFQRFYEKPSRQTEFGKAVHNPAREGTLICETEPSEMNGSDNIMVTSYFKVSSISMSHPSHSL